MVISRDLKEYYARRAEEYEKVYAHPSRQGSIQWLQALLGQWFVGKRVLELSCGTGYWTPTLSAVATSVLATDINASVLEVAKGKSYPRGNVVFQVADAFFLDQVSGVFDAAFSGFWWSHISRIRLRAFLDSLHGRLQPDALVVFADNNPSADLHGRRSEYVDTARNQYSVRVLADGRQYEIIKNFPTESEVRETLDGIGYEVQYDQSPSYWCVCYRTGSS
jgi:demethylmenaquinone methyltransferase/2-methoxy-6-polyprenyl-1,4-benzoquinol methylase